MTQNLVLVVEDNFDIRTSIEHLLVIEGYSVRTATDGNHALELLNQMSALPKVILLDLLMPELSGWDFLGELRKNQAFDKIAVLVMTAVHFSTDKLKPYDIPESSILRKPIDADLLVQTISKHCTD